MIILDEKDKRPIYEQITDKLSELVVGGVLKKDEPLPSVRSFAMELSINPNTVQKAYLELERRGYTYSVKGKGIFISDPEKVRSDFKSGLSREMAELCDRAKRMGIGLEEMLEEVRRNYKV